MRRIMKGVVVTLCFYFISSDAVSQHGIQVINAPEELRNKLGITADIGHGMCVRLGPPPPRGAFETIRPNCRVRRVIDNIYIASVRTMSIIENINNSENPSREQTYEIDNCRQSVHRYERTIERTSRFSVTTAMQTFLENVRADRVERAVTFSLGTQFRGVQFSSSDENRQSISLTSQWNLTSSLNQISETSENITEPMQVDVPPRTRIIMSVSDNVVSSLYGVEIEAILDADISTVHYVDRDNSVWLREGVARLSQSYSDAQRLVRLRGTMRLEAGRRAVRVRISERQLVAVDCQ